jgi:hypothetical protein
MPAFAIVGSDGLSFPKWQITVRFRAGAPFHQLEKFLTSADHDLAQEAPAFFAVGDKVRANRSVECRLKPSQLKDFPPN